MALQGLSKKIQKAVDTSIDGLLYNLDVKNIGDNEIKDSIKSKVSSFTSAKKLLEKWINSPNAPDQKKIHDYTRQLIDAGNSAEKEMEDALEKRIDYSELKGAQYVKAAESKPFILDKINELHSGIVELELQLDNSEINFSDKEFKIGYPERMARGELFPTDQYYQNWYNEKDDAIKIDPMGSEGKIIEVQGLNIQLPEVPVSKNNILFSDKPIKEQYWRRTPMPKGLNPETADQYVDYIIEEFKRRVFGVWFMNKGEPVYLTGHMYFWLQWYQNIENGKYSNFRYAQNYLSYHTKACEVDDRCLGQLFIKSRRTGFTLEKLARKLNLETMTSNFRSGLTSKTGEDALKAFRKKQYAFQNLPFFFRPVVKGSTDSYKQISFGKPSNASKEAKKRNDDDYNDYLNTASDYRTTTNNAYNSEELNDYLGDECGHWELPADFMEHWGHLYPTLDQNGIIVGKGWLGSTVGARDKGGRAIKKLWEGANIKARNKITGRTDNGLYRFFMSIDENSAAHTDIYGVCHQKRPKGQPLNAKGVPITVGANEYWDALESAAKKKGQIYFNQHKRNHPRNIHDAFRDKINDSAFNLERIQDQINYVNRLNSTGNSKTIRGDFAWKNGVMDTEVEFHPNDYGRFEIAWMPPPEMRNRIIRKGSQKAPGNPFLGAGGLDPFRNSQTQDGRGSKGSIHFINRPNAHFPETNRMFVLQYIHRPPTLSQFHEDALMAAVFYGYPIFYENDIGNIEEYFRDRGYLEYLMLRPVRYDTVSNRKKQERGAPGRAKMIDAIYYAINDHINTYIGENEKTGEMGNMFFEDTLTDWMKFEPNNRTDYDATISSGYALCAIQADAPKKKERINYSEETPWRMFDNRGGRSRPKSEK